MIRVTSKTLPTVIDVSKTLPIVDPNEVAEAIGAEQTKMLICEFCGRKFFKSLKSQQRFCNRRCFHAYRSSKANVLATCEICGKQWNTPRSLQTRTCSRECGCKINSASSKDLTKWTDVACSTCGMLVHKRKKDVGIHTFCSRDCRSKGMAKYSQTHDAKADIAYGIKRGTYTSASGENFRYDSSYELRRMKELDYVETDVISWQRCKFVIPYTGTDGNTHHYNPDFLVTRNDDITIEEVKGRMTDTDILKMKAAVDYAKDKGWKYKIIQYDLKSSFPVPKLDAYENDYGVFLRPTEESVFIHMALMIADRSTCLRKKVAAVFTDPEMRRVYCFGYNGNVAGGPNQCDSLDAGACGCTHAEINALTKSVMSLDGATCFVTLSPCLACAKVLINRGIKRVVYYETYRNAATSIALLKKHNVRIEKYENLVEKTSILNATKASELIYDENACCQAIPEAILIATTR